MIVCPVCRFRNPDSNDRCFKCSALLKRNEEIVGKAAAAASSRGRRDMLVRQLTSPLDWLVHRSWFTRLVAIPEDRPFRYPFTAGLLSIIAPGAGHWYAGQSMKAALLFVIGAAIFVFAVITIREPWSNKVLAGALAYWLLVWTDSVAVTTRANGNPWRPRKTLALLFAAMMLFGFSVWALQFFGAGIFTLEKVSSNAMRPGLHAGDRVIFSFVPVWVRDPKPGDMVMFHPEHFSATEGSNIYSVLVKKYYQRVLGVGGDKVAKRGSTFYRNDVPVPEDKIPLGGENLPDFEIVVPANSYFIPVTGIPRDWLSALKGGSGLTHVGQPGFVFAKFPRQAIVPADKVRSKGIAIIDPPPHRRWL